ncbi:MAG TPA: methyltransferase domain-containing protein [Pyrinomonadaceae bacterium]|jgi:2-polyprenyl-3-methyl-5-hydroxy-6-metoxy-1,4-benzoquinol methylase
MMAASDTEQCRVEARARASLGRSETAIYEMVARALNERGVKGEVLVDIGCGSGNLWPCVRQDFARYIGVDVLRYEGFPAEAEFQQVDLDTGRAPLPDGCADTVVAVETIEHLENPRAFMRELTRLCKPGGWVLVTTPNQLSLLSLLTLVTRHRFQAFGETDYPAHLTALLEIDLRRIASECGLAEIAFHYSWQGRLALTSLHYPRFFARLFPRTLSDNLLMIGRKPQ